MHPDSPRRVNETIVESLRNKLELVGKLVDKEERTDTLLDSSSCHHCPPCMYLEKSRKLRKHREGRMDVCVRERDTERDRDTQRETEVCVHLYRLGGELPDREHLS